MSIAIAVDAGGSVARHLVAMAVTQQLGRVERDVLDRCRRDDEFLHRVLDTWDVIGRADVLDLDWSPRALMRLFELVGVDATPLRRALKGDHLVNPAYESHITIQADVTMLDSAAVREVNALLHAPVVAAVGWQSLAMAEPQARAALGLVDFVGSRQRYIDGHLRALREFYAEAERRDLAAIQWWD